MLDLTLLRLKDRPAAFMYNYHHAGYVNGIRMGFDAEMKELGIGRPSTYASTLQVLKDRNYVRTEKNRFFAEESGRLLTAFLERFFPRYVAYEFTAGMEDELDEVSGGRAGWKPLLEKFWKDFKPKSDEVMEKKPSEVTEALDEFLSDFLFPPSEDGADPRTCPSCGTGRLSLKISGKYGAFVGDYVGGVVPLFTADGNTLQEIADGNPHGTQPMFYGSWFTGDNGRGAMGLIVPYLRVADYQP